MGVARIFSGGEHFFKNCQKIFKKFSKNFQKISKIFKIFFTKIAKMHYFSIVFSQFNMAWVQFFTFGRKTKFAGNLWENFRKFSNVFLPKLLKMDYFSRFFTKFKKPCVNFLRVWTKNEIVGKFWEIFDENSIEKLNFFYFLLIIFYFFRKFVIKNRAFGNNFQQLQQFFRFRGGGFPLPPGYALAPVCYISPKIENLWEKFSI